MIYVFFAIIGIKDAFFVKFPAGCIDSDSNGVFVEHPFKVFTVGVVVLDVFPDFVSWSVGYLIVFASLVFSGVRIVVKYFKVIVL